MAVHASHDHAVGPLAASLRPVPEEHPAEAQCRPPPLVARLCEARMAHGPGAARVGIEGDSTRPASGRQGEAPVAPWRPGTGRAASPSQARCDPRGSVARPTVRSTLCRRHRTFAVLYHQARRRLRARARLRPPVAHSSTLLYGHPAAPGRPDTERARPCSRLRRGCRGTVLSSALRSPWS